MFVALNNNLSICPLTKKRVHRFGSSIDPRHLEKYASLPTNDQKLVIQTVEQYLEHAENKATQEKDTLKAIEIIRSQSGPARDFLREAKQFRKY